MLLLYLFVRPLYFLYPRIEDWITFIHFCQEYGVRGDVPFSAMCILARQF